MRPSSFAGASVDYARAVRQPLSPMQGMADNWPGICLGNPAADGTPGKAVDGAGHLAEALIGRCTASIDLGPTMLKGW